MSYKQGGILYRTKTIYRVTRKARYGRESVRLCSKQSVTLQISAFKQAVEYATRYGHRPPETDILKIERAEIGPFEDVTTDFLS